MTEQFSNEPKLFESGCSLCGAPEWRPNTGLPLTIIKDVGRYCGACWVSHDEKAADVHAEITRRRAALAAEQKGAEVLKIGDYVSGTGLSGATRNGHLMDLGGTTATLEDNGRKWLTERSTLRRCENPAPSHPKPVEAKREDPYAERRRAIAAKFGYAPDVTTELLDYQVAWATKDRAELTRPAAFPSREPPPRVPAEHPAAWPAGSFDDVDELGCS